MNDNPPIPATVPTMRRVGPGPGRPARVSLDRDDIQRRIAFSIQLFLHGFGAEETLSVLT